MTGHPCSVLTLLAVVALLAPVRSLQAQTPAATPLVSVEQAGRTVQPSGDTLRLQRDAFTLVLRLPRKTLATVHAAQGPDAFDLAKAGKPLDAVFVSEGTLAMSSGNTSRTLFLSDDAPPRFQAWYFESERDHSFDSATVQDDTILARFTVAELALPAPAHYHIARFPGRELYLIVRLVDETTNREVHRQALALTFDDITAGAGLPRPRPSGEAAGVEREDPPLQLSPDAPQPKKTKHVEPAYPETALRSRIQGVVTIEAIIGTNGRVLSAHVVRSVPLLDEAALDAVRQWEYEPLLVEGVPRAFVMTTNVTFSLR